MKLVSEARSADCVVNKNILFVLALWLWCWSNWIPTYLPTPLFALHVQHAVLTKVAPLVLACPSPAAKKHARRDFQKSKLPKCLLPTFLKKTPQKYCSNKLSFKYFKWIGFHLRCDWVDTLYTLVVTSVVVLSSAPPCILNLGKTNVRPADIFTYGQL